MGFLKMFGVGGGKLDVVLSQAQVNAGEALTGVARFIGGKRAQDIDAINLSVTCTLYHTDQTPQGPQRRSESQTLVPKTSVVTGAHCDAGGNLEYPFSFPIPATAYSSAAGLVEYRLHGSADIDGEVDPGDSEVFMVLGGQDYTPADSMTGPVVGQLQVGDNVMAQWKDNNWHPGRVASVTDQYVAVDWDEDELGASSWVPHDQVMSAEAYQAAQDDDDSGDGASVSPDVAAKKALMGKAAPVDPKVLAAAKAKLMAAQAAAGKVAPAAAKPAPAQPMPAKMAPAAAPALKVGMPVMAQYKDGNWHPGKVVAFQDAWIGVDWDDAKLGDSSWLQASQIKPR